MTFIKAVAFYAVLAFGIAACTEVYVSVDHAIIDIDTNAEVNYDINP